MAQQLQQHPRLALGGRRSHLRGARAGPPGGGRGREGKRREGGPAPFAVPPGASPHGSVPALHRPPPPR